jgi:hypothetical protein
MATNITAFDAVASTVTKKRKRQFQGLFTVIEVTVSLDENTIAAQVASVASVTVPGAELGDFVLVAPVSDSSGLLIHGFVSAADTVKVMAFNVEGTDAVTVLSAAPTFRILVLKPSASFAQ